MMTWGGVSFPEIEKLMTTVSVLERDLCCASAALSLQVTLKMLLRKMFVSVATILVLVHEAYIQLQQIGVIPNYTHAGFFKQI